MLYSIKSNDSKVSAALQEQHLIAVMKSLMVFITAVAVVDSGFIPPIQERGFMPINHRWQTSLEESGYGDLSNFQPENHELEFGEQSSDLHLHEDHGRHHYEHFEDSAEEQHPSFEEHSLPEHSLPEHSLPEHSFPEEYETKKERTVHVHEHHHHYHRHYKTLPISIIKKTVFFKHG